MSFSIFPPCVLNFFNFTVQPRSLPHNIVSVPNSNEHSPPPTTVTYPTHHSTASQSRNDREAPRSANRERVPHPISHRKIPDFRRHRIDPLNLCRMAHVDIKNDNILFYLSKLRSAQQCGNYVLCDLTLPQEENTTEFNKPAVSSKNCQKILFRLVRKTLPEEQQQKLDLVTEKYFPKKVFDQLLKEAKNDQPDLWYKKREIVEFLKSESKDFQLTKESAPFTLKGQDLFPTMEGLLSIDAKNSSELLKKMKKSLTGQNNSSL